MFLYDIRWTLKMQRYCMESAVIYVSYVDTVITSIIYRKFYSLSFEYNESILIIFVITY